MKKQVYLAIGFSLLAVCFIRKNGRIDAGMRVTPEKSGKDTSKPRATKVNDNPYEGLKRLAYSVTYSQLHLPDPGGKEVLYGVLMDWDFEGKGVITLVTFKSGEASIYFSTGSGNIGGGQHEDVKKAVKMFVEEAQSLLNRATNKDTALKSESSVVKFYLMTNKGKYTVKDKMANINNRTSLISPMFEKAINLIDQIRSADQ
jgi:hypothetical protein